MKSQGTNLTVILKNNPMLVFLFLSISSLSAALAGAQEREVIAHTCCSLCWRCCTIKRGLKVCLRDCCVPHLLLFLLLCCVAERLCAIFLTKSLL